MKWRMYLEMKLLNVLIPALLLALVSCGKRDDSHLQMVRDQFHGKYKALEVTSDKAIDVNLDGLKKRDLLQEIPALQNSFLELRTQNLHHLTPGVFLFSLSWPNQYFVTGSGEKTPAVYDPEIAVHYMKQPIIAKFRFANSYHRINLFRDGDEYSKFQLPDSVLVEGDRRIRVFLTKRLYTTSGWEEVKVEVLYEHFTTST